jgi:hypothetical protein
MDGCFGQANNKTMVKYNLHITDPDSDMYMYERVDEHVCIKGHSYMVCDQACGAVERAAKTTRVISDMYDWIDIMAHMPHMKVVEHKQSMHR